MKFSVGFPNRAGGSFFTLLTPYLDRIGELYFPWEGFAGGRAPADADPLARLRLEEELARFAEAGVRLNLLLNGSCYGGEAISDALAHRVCAAVDYLGGRYGLATVTTASPFIAATVKRWFPQIDVRASVNMWLEGIDGMRQCADLFDSFYVKREYNRRPDEIAAERDWCRANGKRLYLLANSGCIPNCAFHIFHDTMISHAAEVARTRNDEAFQPYACRRLLAKEENRYLLLAGNLVRPEDVHHYEGLVDGVKLATRIHPYPVTVIGAYARGRFEGDLSALTEPGFGDLIAPYMLENSAIPADFWERTAHCGRDCRRDGAACGYCGEVYEQIRRKQ
ncbi:MAG: hypothetical protein IJF67_08390 [Clostridia bacterium]|nr:hypothetical protein [Clostridia bacterium]